MRTGLVAICALGLATCLAAQEQRPEPATTLARVETGKPKTVPAEKASPSSAGPPLKLATSVNVKAREDASGTPQAISTEEVTGTDVLESAGTWSDLPRFLQTLAGVIGGSDTQNAFSVRGGNSFENAFVVDRFEVPNINQLALDGSTGGLGSMLGAELIGSVALHTGDVSARNSSRLSSLTEIRTIEIPDQNLTAIDLGYSGGGIRISRWLGRDKSLLFSLKESVTNLFIKDIGLNGSPEFTNSLIRYTDDLSPRDHVWMDALSGRDALKVRPTWFDLSETNAFNTDYSGWRNTTGVVWQHTLRSDAVSTWLLSNSQDVQRVDQATQPTPVLQYYQNFYQFDVPFSFQQSSGEGVTQVKYEYQYADENGSGSDFGADIHANRMNYTTQQSGGIFSPYSASATPEAAFTLAPSFSSIDRALFADWNADFKRRVFLRSGVRLQTWGLPSITGAKTAWMPHASISALVSQRFDLRASYSKSAQLPPYSVIGGAPGNTALGLIQSSQVVAGGTFQINRILSLNVEAYRKTYANYPVSINYPEVSLATLAPVIDEPFVALSMTSAGAGLSRGIEISLKQNPIRHVFTRANLSTSRSTFSGLDGVYRPGTNDLPFVLNALLGFQAGRYSITARETMTSGRPYTPALMDASYAQNRLIYDLTQINALRGSLYNRVDIAVNRDVQVHGRPMRIHAGVLNVLDRANFYTYDWAPRYTYGAVQQNGIGIRPDVNVSYTF